MLFSFFFFFNFCSCDVFRCLMQEAMKREKLGQNTRFRLLELRIEKIQTNKQKKRCAVVRVLCERGRCIVKILQRRSPVSRIPVSTEPAQRPRVTFPGGPGLQHLGVETPDRTHYFVRASSQSDNCRYTPPQQGCQFEHPWKLPVLRARSDEWARCAA